MNLNFCPFCGSKDVHSYEVAAGGVVGCEHCGASIESHRSVAAAVLMWNSRVGDQKSKFMQELGAIFSDYGLNDCEDRDYDGFECANQGVDTKLWCLSCLSRGLVEELKKRDLV